MSFTEVEDFVVPDALPEGSDVTVRILLRNTGNSGRLDYYIDGNPASPDRYTQVESGRTPGIVSPGSAVWVDVPFRYFPMPAWDYKLTASNEDNTSSISRTIALGVVALGEFRFDSWSPPLDTREVFIVGAAWPALVRKVDVGEDVYAYYVIKNVGTVAGEPKLTVKDLDTGSIIKTWSYPELAPNARFKTGAPGTYIGKMPSRDWRLEFKVDP